MDLKKTVNNYIENGYSFNEAISKTCQDIILIKLSKSRYKQNITIKGGVVMHNISNNIRRATKDIDIDFIKYSLDDNSIKQFITNLNNLNDGISITINGNIEKLNHQDYDGKRIYVSIKDINNYVVKTKIDIGVHKQFDINQEEYGFNINGEQVNLLINTVEQIFTEKLKSILKIGIKSTRYKDIFDFYYLINNTNINKLKLLYCINTLIFNDENMKENNIDTIVNKLNSIYNSKRYKSYLDNPKVNWINEDIDKVIKVVINYIFNLSKVKN